MASRYDSEEYIQKVMAYEKCDRKGALALIEDFKKIDRGANRGYLTKRVSANTFDRCNSQKALQKNIRQQRKAEHKCMVCGRQDSETLEGKSRCAKCALSQKKYMERRKKGIA